MVHSGASASIPTEGEESPAHQFLRLIADGYFVDVQDDRFVRCGNPHYEPDNGQDPYIVYDVDAEVEDLDGPGSVGYGQLSEIF